MFSVLVLGYFKLNVKKSTKGKFYSNCLHFFRTCFSGFIFLFQISQTLQGKESKSLAIVSTFKLLKPKNSFLNRSWVGPCWNKWNGTFSVIISSKIGVKIHQKSFSIKKIIVG